LVWLAAADRARSWAAKAQAELALSPAAASWVLLGGGPSALNCA
jgi:hypothetical protein